MSIFRRRSSKEQEAKKDVRIEDVSLKGRNTYLDLGKKMTAKVRESVPVIEIHLESLRPFLRKYRSQLSVIAVALVLFATFGIFAAGGHASVVTFYPNTCLGGWQYSDNATGAPSLPSGAPLEQFTTSNSAVLKNSSAQIYCGTFQGDIPNDATPKKFTLTFNWSVDDGTITHDQPAAYQTPATPGVTVEDGTATTAPADDTASGTPVTSDDTTSSDASGQATGAAPADSSDTTASQTITMPTTAPASDSSDASSTPATDQAASVPASAPAQAPVPPSDASEITITPDASAPADTSAPTAPAASSPDSDSPADASPAPTPAPADSGPQSFLNTLAPTTVFAQDADPDSVTASSTPADSATDTAADTGEASITPAIVPAPAGNDTASGSTVSSSSEAPEDAFATVAFTLDGSTWNTLGTVGYSNWRQASFDIPLDGWTDISKLQVSITPIQTFDTEPVIYLDAMQISVNYDSQPVSAKPTVKIQNQTAMVLSGPTDFTSDEAPQFAVVDPNLSTTDIAALVKDNKAEVVEDSSGVLAAENSVSPAAPVSAPASGNLIDQVKDYFSPSSAALGAPAASTSDSSSDAASPQAPTDTSTTNVPAPDAGASAPAPSQVQVLEGPPVSADGTPSGTDSASATDNQTVPASNTGADGNSSDNTASPAANPGAPSAPADPNAVIITPDAAAPDASAPAGTAPASDPSTTPTAPAASPSASTTAPAATTTAFLLPPFAFPPLATTALFFKNTENHPRNENALKLFRPLVAHAEDGAFGAAPTIMTAKVLDDKGNPTTIEPKIETVTINGKSTEGVVVPKPEREFHAGSYTLEVTVETSDAIIISDQDFTWGVLAINTDKATYTEGDTAYLQMGVLDDYGNTICNASLDLTITTPSGVSTELTTDAGTVIQEPKCGHNNVIDVPDYYAHYPVPSESGTYQMVLSATTAAGTHTVNDTFDVASSVAFDVVRAGPTRIFPPHTYPMTMTITSPTDWSGTVYESAPSSFSFEKSSVGQSYDNVSVSGDTATLSWQVNLTAGQPTEIGYDFLAPPVSPEFYLLGPLQFVDESGATVFTEAREWQIAADATCTATTGTPNWNTTGTWSCGRVPLSTDTVIIPSGSIVTVNTAAVASTLEIQSPTSADGLSISTGESVTVSGTTTFDANTTANAETITMVGTGNFTSNGNITVNAPTSTGADNVTCSGGTCTGTFATGGSATITIDGAATTSGTVTFSMGTGTLTSGGLLTLAGGTTGGNISITSSTGTINTNAGVTFTGTAARDTITTSGAASWNDTGTIGSGGTLSIFSTTTLTTTGTSAINGAYTWGKLTVSSGTTTLGANETFAGAVSVSGTLTLGAFTLTDSSTTTVNSGGTMQCPSAASCSGLKTFTGLVTTNTTTGTFNLTTSSTAATTTFAGGMTSNGSTFNTGTGATTLSATQTIQGSTGITIGGAVTVNSGVVVTASGSGTLTLSSSLSFSSSGTASGLTISSTNTVNVVGATTCNSPSAAVSTTIAIGTGTFSSAGITLNGSATSGHTCAITNNGGTLTTTAGLTTTGTAAQMTYVDSSAGFFNLTGTLGANFGTFTMNNGTTLTTTGTSAINGAYTVGLLTVSTGTTTLGANVTAAGAVDVVASAELLFGAFTFSANTTTLVDGTITCPSASCSGLKTFSSTLTVDSGATFDLSPGTTPATTSFGGNIVDNGTTFNTDTGTSVFTASLALSGSGNMTFGGASTINSGFTLTDNNTGTVTFSSTLTGGSSASSYATGSGSYTLFASTAMATGTLVPSTSSNTIEYSGASITIKTPTTNNYYNLTLSGSGTDVISSITGTAGNFTLSGTVTTTTVSTFTSIGGNLSIGSGCTLHLDGFTFGVTGTTTLTGGTLDTVTSGSGTKTFTGLVTVTTGTFDLSGQNPTVQFAGGVTMNGTTFNSGTGTLTFTATQTLDGSVAMTFGGAATINSGVVVTAQGSHTITFSSTLAFASSATTSGLTINASGTTVAVTSTTTCNSPSAAITTTLAIGAGTFTSAGIAMNGSATSGHICAITKSTGTLTTTAGITTTGTASRMTYIESNAGAFNLTGSLGASFGTFTMNSGSTLTTQGTAAINGAYTVGLLTVGGSSATTTMGAAVVAAGAVTVNSGDTLQLGAFNFTANTTTDISGTLNDNSATGTKIFIGAVTMHSGGIWTETNNPGYTFRGGLACNSTSGFTSGTGTYTFNTNAQTISSSGGGTCSITNLTNSVTTSTGLTISSAQPTVGTLTQSANAILTFSGAMPTITTPAFTASGNTVQYTNTSAGQTVISTTYNNLTINDSGQTATLGGAVTVNGNLTITAGTLDASSSNYAIALGGNWSNSGTFTAESGTVTLSGTVTQTISGTLTGTSAFYNLVITNNSGVNPSANEITGMTASVDFSASATATNGYTINAAHSRIEYTSGDTYTFTNVNWVGTSGAGNSIYFRNSATSGTWLLDVSGTQTVSYVNVSRSNASGGNAIHAYDGTSTDATNNTNWVFTGISISGTSNVTGTVHVAINGTPDTVDTATISGSAWTLYVSTLSATNVITVWIEGATSANQTTGVTVYSSGNITGMVLNANVLTIGSNQNTSVTLTNIDSYDCTSDQYVMDSVTSSVLTVSGAGCTGGSHSYTNPTLSILSGNTLTIGATETAVTGLVNNAGTLTLTTTAALTLNGTSGTLFTNSGTFNQTASTITLSGNGSATVSSFALGIYNLTSSGTGTKTFGAAVTGSVTGTISVTAGTLDTGGFATSTGFLNIGAAGTFSPSSTTVLTLTGTTGTLLTMASGGAFTQGSSSVVVASASGTPTLLSAATTFNQLTIDSAATVINAGAPITMSNTNTSNKLWVEEGVLNDGGNQITGTTNGTLEVDAGAALCISGTAAATNATCDSGATPTTATTFPTNYSNAHITLAAGTDGISPGWYNSAWGYRTAITINHSQVPNTDQTNFPVLVSQTNSNWEYGGAGHMGNSDGSDILFTSANGTTKLDYERESYTSGTGAVIAWVRIPILSHSTDTTIYMYYGNAGAADQQNPTGVWDSYYKLVNHFPNGSTLSLADSTSNSVAETNNGLTAGSGLIDGGVVDNGSSTYATFPYSPSFNFSGGNWTMEAWINSSSFSSPQIVISKDTHGSNYDWSMYIENSTTLALYSQGTAANLTVTVPAMAPNTWHFIVFRNISGTNQIFLDGVSYGTNTMAITNADTTEGSIGASGYSAPNSYFDGTMDELRISNGSGRSTDWINTEFNNYNSPSTFETVGSQTAYASSTGSSIVYYNADAAMTVSGTPTYGDLRFQPILTAARTYTISGAMTVNGDWYINPNSTGANLLTVNAGGAMTVDAGHTTYIEQQGSMATSDLDVRPSSTDYNLTTGYLNIGSDDTLDATSSAATITVEGTANTLITLSGGTFNSGNSTVNLSGNGSATVSSSAMTFYNLTSSGTGTKTLAAAATINNNFTISAGTFSDGGNQITGNSSGTLSASSGTTLNLLTAGATPFPTSFTTANISLDPASTVVYDSITNATISGTPNYGNLELSASSGTPTKSLGANATINGSLTIDASNTLNAAGSSITLGGNWTNNGTFTPTVGTVTLTSAATAAVNGSTTFYNLTITNSTAKEVDFAASGGTPTYTVSNVFTVTGFPGQFMKLRSAASPTKWDFLPSGTAAVAYADVQDGGCHSGAILITAFTSVNSGNNDSCWTFSGPTLTFSIGSNIVSLGTLTTSTTGIGSHTLSVATNGTQGFSITYSGPSLTNGSYSMATLSGTTAAGTEGFGFNLADTAPVVTSGTCTALSGYATASQYSFTANTPTAIANSSGAPASCTFTATYMANISSVTPAGSYTTPITYMATGTF